MAKSKKAGGEPIASVAKVEKVALDTTIAEDILAAPRPSRKRAGEFFDFDGEDEDVNSNIPTKRTKTKAAKSRKKPKIVPSFVDATRLSKLESHPVEAPETHAGEGMVEVELARATQPSVDLEDDAIADGDHEEEAEEEEERDQTLALLNSFDSGDEDQFSGEEIFKQGQNVPKIPEKSAKKLKAAKFESEEPGVVFVGHIPHGFYEHEMNAYFSQFGTITRIRLSRNRKTGRSKHYAFIEFESAEVAKIVANTMDKYLLFGHILKCKFAAPEKIHPEVWKGANKRFKVVPWNKIERRQLELPMGREGWEKRTEREKKRREGKNDRTKDIGYEYKGAQLKSVDEVPSREVPKQIEAEQTAADEIIEEEKTVIVQKGEEEGTIVISEETRTTRARRGDKQEAKETVGGGTAPEAKKAKKSKKAKAREQEQVSTAIQNTPEVVRASEAQTTAAVEMGKGAIQQRAASTLGEAGKTAVAIQEQAVPTPKKARRARESLRGDSTSLVKKPKDTAGAVVAHGSHKMEESIQDAAAYRSKPKKAKKSKQSN